jgi:hypothetical protein
LSAIAEAAAAKTTAPVIAMMLCFIADTLSICGFNDGVRTRLLGDAMDEKVQIIGPFGIDAERFRIAGGSENHARRSLSRSIALTHEPTAIGLPTPPHYS